ncbi:PA0069 family radical SAM protein [Novispirillum itersonii]|uniref:PA0069 family radical SAM protein n=1 Tax=Novispirillum itersonii TaxID=189 RepID=UPI0003768059|nr:PA0069 family radical SAM protein [Novispirillum itersonii]
MEELPPSRTSDLLKARHRGTLSNRSGRYEAAQRVFADDGWGSLAGGWWSEDSAANQPPLQTTVQPDASRSILARNDSPDLPFERSVNPYRGCEHGCAYCFARPSHAWLGLSPGLDFETRLFSKPEAGALLEQAFRARTYRPAPLGLGTNTDPWQPVERKLGITRSVLTVLEAYQHPVAIVTKGAMITRDVDILARMAVRGLVLVCISITTLDPDLSRRLEPRASTPAARLKAVRVLSEAGVPVRINAAPMIPGLNDHELDAILGAGKQAGGRYAGAILLRLPQEVRSLFTEWLETHVPDRAGRVLSLIRQCRDGDLNSAAFGDRMRGQGPVADLLWQRFRLAARRNGLLLTPPALRTDLFACPLQKLHLKVGDQMALL